MKIKFKSDDSLPLTKTFELHNMIIIVKSVFNDANKYASTSSPLYMFVQISWVRYKCWSRKAKMLTKLVTCVSELSVITATFSR